MKSLRSVLEDASLGKFAAECDDYDAMMAAVKLGYVRLDRSQDAMKLYLSDKGREAWEKM
jgi:hypothetical protein